MAIGKEAYGLYILDKALVQDTKFSGGRPSSILNSLSITNSSEMLFSCNNVSKSLSIDVWHKRVGHIPYVGMKLLHLGIEGDHMTQGILCDVYPWARQ